MALEALANKYRPKKIADVIGQPCAATSIINGFKSKTLSHAYIFSGFFGSGKTSSARILAAMDNCSKGPTIEPCGECQNCKEIFEGKSIDVRELDAASNRSIDDIRDIAKDARYAPINCRVKYYIIDEAHGLTGQAAEAALKVIEEPPERVRFILATTEPHLFKDTVDSRCITLRFNKVSWVELTQHLLHIAKLEGLDVEENAAKLIARSSKGSIRNTLTKLQTVVNYTGGGKITYEASRDAIGAIDEKLYGQLIEAVYSVQVPQGMIAVQEFLKDGKSAQEVVNGIFNHLRNLMLTLTCKGDLSVFGLTEDEIQRYSEQAKKLSGTEAILEMMNLLRGVQAALRVNLDPQTRLEQYLIECIIVNKRLAAKKQQVKTAGK